MTGALNMLGSIKARGAARGFTLALSLFFSATIASEVTAKPKTRKLQPVAEQTASVPAHLSAAASARFFTINQVLAKLDRGGRAQSVRFAAVSPSDTLTDIPAPSMVRQPPLSEEPFGLFTFRAPEGLLWFKWRRVQDAI